MSIVSVTEKVATRSGGDTMRTDGGIDGNHRRTFTVICNHHADDDKKVLRDNRIPRLYETYKLGQSSDPGTVVGSRSAHQISKFIWEVECHYKVMTLKTPPSEAGSQPLDRPPVVVWGSRMREWYSPNFIDAMGTKVFNSAGQPLSPGIPIEKADLTVSITRNEAGFRAKTDVLPLLGKLNKRRWSDFAIREVKMTGVTARSQWEGIEYWVVGYAFAIRYGGWGEMAIDKGRTVKVTTVPGTPEHYLAGHEVAKDQNGVAAGDEVLLNGRGKPLLPGREPVMLPHGNMTVDSMEESEFYRNSEADFSRLQFPWINTQ